MLIFRILSEYFINASSAYKCSLISDFLLFLTAGLDCDYRILQTFCLVEITALGQSGHI